MIVPFRATLIVALLSAPLLLAQEPAAEPPPVISRAVVPVTGDLPGYGVHWRSDVAIWNDTAEEVTVVVSPLPHPELFQMMTLAPGQSILFPNVANESFGIGGRVAPLLVQTLARRSVSVAATAYGIREGALTPTQIIPVLYDELPPAVQQLGSLAMNEAYRSNIGLVNLGPAPVPFTLALQRVEGRNLAIQTVVVGPESSVHVPLNVLFPLVTEGEDLTLLVDSPAPRTYAYASIVRNDTHEAYFVQPLVRFR